MRLDYDQKPARRATDIRFSWRDIESEAKNDDSAVLANRAAEFSSKTSSDGSEKIGQEQNACKSRQRPQGNAPARLLDAIFHYHSDCSPMAKSRPPTAFPGSVYSNSRALATAKMAKQWHVPQGSHSKNAWIYAISNG
ncbi:MAG TPA: hypothetical protein VK181_06125 [Rhizobium sp.]|nr:hypothetical protein [Rhizobium sp.]